MTIILIPIILLLLALVCISVILSDPARINPKIDRKKMIDSILQIEKILNLSNTHLEIELDLMSDQDLTNLYRNSVEKFDRYIAERNADNNKKALEDF